jgi:hypothetical protein
MLDGHRHEFRRDFLPRDLQALLDQAAIGEFGRDSQRLRLQLFQ